MTLRVLIAVTHLLGVGHLARAAAIARGLARAGHAVTLVSGGRPAPLIATDGVRLVQLPPVHVEGTAFSALLGENGGPAGEALMARRRDLLLDALADTRPHVVVTELFPFGRRALAGEFLALVEAARRQMPPPLVLASIRDVLVAPARAGRVEEAHARLLAHYDGVLVHGDAGVLPLERSWPVTPDIAPLLDYTGYVDDTASRSVDDGTDGAGEILVSGGGSATSLPLFRAALGAAVLASDRRWRLLVGRGVAGQDFSALADAAPANVTVERARPDFAALLSRAAVSISQAGYNTVIDVLNAGVRAVLVPFEAGNETEQRLRAEALARAGVWPFVVVGEADLSAETLARAVDAALAAPLPQAVAIARDGIARSVALIERRAAAPLPRLARVLDEAQAMGRAVSFWWRDDDAVTPTPALERLLALANRHAMPVAVAAIPAHADAALAARLAREPLARALVHGLSHANHAPAGEKKAEFGPHRPADALARDAETALRLAAARFGDTLLPVFVPPWNRIDGELAKSLAGMGYRGLSTFGRAGQVAGIAVANTHLDPVAWHDGGGLAPRARIDAAAAAFLRAQLEGGGEPVLGLLTHHLVQDEDTWTWCDAVLSFLLRHPAVIRADAEKVFRFGSFLHAKT